MIYPKGYKEILRWAQDDKSSAQEDNKAVVILTYSEESIIQILRRAQDDKRSARDDTHCASF